MQPSYAGMPWDARGMPVVAGMCLYCVNKLFIKFKKSTGTRTKNIYKNEACML